MRDGFWRLIVLFLFFPAILLPSTAAWGQVQVVEVFCRSCGYRGRFIQGADQKDAASNVQNIIVVCERTREIRNIRIPINPDAPTKGNPLIARQYGLGKSELLGIRLPKFLVPGTTCPLFPLASYLEWNICPIDGGPGITVAPVPPH